ncbi:oxygenase MpaB family protein [Sphingomonas sp. CFBP8993]|uniref:oxygenase MpaB family protein n=1 Tax=Sphingomonas sp. CFBP8993 TaxID=3096526 RepID=UPI002A6B080B|nr:oxygenase MpaB family protein [Sphingomonas sp. CFBP8993]MDY0959553.1 oxygenase MpaB family protein [Sphingomonas sp. CFBP8993]
MLPVRRQIADQIRDVVGSRELDLTRPPGDDGLFGPGSATWVVHGDFTAMMAGGIASLLVQMLHPAALAGVWDHSGFRHDMAGRLRRTAGFITVTTYGATDAAEGMIARVRAVHDRVGGTLPDGTPYSANDPHLLTFVHAAEVDSFLRAHRTYRDPDFPDAEADRYLAEMASIARRLGAENVPEDRHQLAKFLDSIRPELRVDARTRAVARTLLNQPAPSPALAPVGAWLTQAGIALLPDWAARLHGLDGYGAVRPAIRAGTRRLGGAIRWALAG